MSTNDQNKKLSETLEEQIQKSKKRNELLEKDEELKRVSELIEKKKEYAETLANEFKMLESIGMAGADLAKVKKELAAVEEQIANTNQVMLEARAAGDEETAKQFEREIEQANTRLNVLSKVSEAQDNYKQNLSDIAKEERSLRIESGKLEEEFEKIKKTGLGGFFEEAFGSAPGIVGDIYRQAGKVRSAFGKLGLDLAKFAESGSLFARAIPGLGSAAQQLVNISTMNLSKLFAPVAIGLAVVKIVRMSLAVNKLSKDLGAATGFGDKFNEEITNMAVAGNAAGIGFEESAAALKSMTSGLSSFNPNAEETNQNIGMTIARLEKLGVSSDSSVKSIDHLQRTMGMTAEQAADTTAQIARFGKEIGITGTKAINDFNSASGRLAIFGKNNIKVFKGLAAAAKASGIEMQSLINIAQQFDTFDKAADSAAKLNSVLGTQLSTIDLMNASDEERIMMIKQQVQASVGNFDSLDKFTKQYIQQAMGVASVDEAQRLLNMSTAEYQKFKNGQQEQADIQAELAEATEDLVPLTTQLKLAFTEAFLAFSPIIEGIAVIMSMLPSVVEYLSYVAKGILLVAAVWALMNIQAMTFAGVMSTLGLPLLVGALTLIVGLIGFLAEQFFVFLGYLKKKFNPNLGQVFHFLADGLTLMVAPLKYVIDGIGNLTGRFAGLFGVAKADAADVINKDGFSLQAMANIDTDKVTAGIGKVKSALVDLSNVSIDGFLALRTDGTSTSMIMGSDGIIKQLSEGKLTVDVKMPEFKMPEVNVQVFIGNEEFAGYVRGIAKEEARAVKGAIGGRRP